LTGRSIGRPGTCPDIPRSIERTWPRLPWFGGVRVLSLPGDVGGLGRLGFGPAAACVAVWRLVIIALAARAALPAEMMLRMERMS